MSTGVSQRDFTGGLLPRALAELRNDQATGTLRVITLTATRDFLYVDGEVRAARSTAETEKLGSWLVAKGVITEVFKQSALLSQEGGDSPPFGHILVARGVTTSQVLERHLENLALTILERAASEEHRRSVFLDHLGSGQLDTLPGIATPQLILIAARVAGSTAAKRLELGQPDHLVVRRSSVDEIVQEFSLHVPEAIILGKLNNGQTVGQLRKISTLTDDQFYTAAYALKMAGIIEVFAKPTRGATTSTTAAEKTPQEPKGETQPRPGRSHTTVADPAAEQEEIKRLAKLMKTANHYEFLGINRHASYQEIFDAWERFQMKFSPDRASEEHLEGLGHQLTAISEHAQDAFDVLSSPVKRPRYERMIRADADIEAESASSPGSIGADPVAARAFLVTHNLRQVDKLVRTGDIFSAVRLLEQTCDLDPQPTSLLKLAKLMLINPNWTNRALEKLRRAVEIDPSFVDGWLAVADFWRDRKSVERERKAVEKALAADPEHQQSIERYRLLRGPSELQAFLDRVRRKSD